MKEYTIMELEMTLGMMRSAQNEHPKATIIFNPEKNRVDITHPLPIDIRSIEISSLKIKK